MKENYKQYPSLPENLNICDLDNNNSLKKMVIFIGENKTILDFGCASGYLANFLKKQGCKVTGLEINSEAAEIARQYCEEVFVCDLDFHSLHDILGDRKFDVAVFGDVLEHSRNPWKVLEQTKDFLNPSGYVVASIPNIAHGAVRLALLEGNFDYMPSGILDDTHLRFFTRKTVEELFERNGYFIHQVDYTKLEIFSQNPLIPYVQKENFAVELIGIFKEDKNIDILQFIIKAFPSNFNNKYFSLKQNYEIVVKNLQETQATNEIVVKNLQETQYQLQETQSQLQETQATIVAMETSKFWKLRKIWFKFKTIFKIKKKLKKIVKLILNLRLILILLFTYGLTCTINLLKRKEEIPISDDIRYQQWLNKNYPKTTDLIFMTEDIKNLSYKPLISVIVPVYNTPRDFLKEAIDSVLNQIYPYWELCIADDASTKPYMEEILQEYALRDKRIKVAFRKENGHISRSSNSAIELANGEYIALLDHDDLLTTNALYEVVKLLNKYPEADMIYSDEDKINEEEKLQDPYFKPDWCPDSFLSRMYTCHLGVYRLDLVREIGGFREGYEGSQDYDLVLRLTEKTDKIFHIPKILYHWRIHAESTAQDISTKNYATIAAQRAIKDALERRGESGKVIPVAGGHHIVRYEIKHHDLVSIIIPTKNLGNILNTCLKSIFEKTTYSNYEVLVVDNGSTEKETKEIIELWKIKEPQRFRCEILDIPFNFSKINNYAVKQTKGKYLLFLNNDTEVINNDWLDGMVEQAQRNSIGAVGALLLYPDNTIQHAGVVRGIGGVAGHSHKYFVGDSYGYFNQLKTVNNYSSVTGACLMCRREVFEEVGGFEESLAVAFNDIDLCLKFLEKGYRNVYLPHVKLYHYESKSRGYEDTPEKQRRFSHEVKYMQSKWQKIIDYDPCYSPNLTKQTEDYAIDIP
ncbi:MAG: glycosyltransferase [Cuspidothrix sp.]